VQDLLLFFGKVLPLKHRLNDLVDRARAPQRPHGINSRPKQLRVIRYRYTWHNPSLPQTKTCEGVGVGQATSFGSRLADVRSSLRCRQRC
jgi:hypothetical protein